MPDFFVSYNRHDRRWAEWIAWQLEEASFSVVIQAWDFTGNWIEAMDRAMRESERTIAVLSPDYLSAVYTRSEWADAFRRDPTGELDLLVPIKVAAVDLTGILAQIVHVDLVDVPEDEALRRLLARAHRQRGKPARAPGFPGEGPQQVIHGAVAQRPPYPAAQEDTQRLRLARELLIAFRSQFAARCGEFEAFGAQARRWSRLLPTAFDDAVDRTIVVAAEVAEALRGLPVSDLEFASAYGLNVHETVFWGQAIDTAIAQRALFDAPTRAARARHGAERQRLGLKSPGDSTPEAYVFEMLARVFESATGLLEYDMSQLPRGFVPAPVGAASSLPDLRGTAGLFMARVDGESGVRLMAARPQPRTVGTFTARKLSLRPRVARRNRAGTLDLVADDTQYHYYFADSAVQPAAQFPKRSSVLDARFASDAPGDPAILLLADGTVESIDGSGVFVSLGACSTRRDIVGGCLWIDPLDPAVCRILTATRRGWDVTSEALDGSAAVSRPGAELWQDASIEAAFGRNPYWTGTELSLAVLNGMDCLLARCTAQWGAVVQFLDPRKLVALRPPLTLHGFAGDMTIASGRWLVVAFLQDKAPRRLAVWDLRSSIAAPVASAYPEVGDCYGPVIVDETPDRFRSLQVFRTLNIAPPNRFELVGFDGPQGLAQPLGTYDRLQIWPVA